MKVILVKALGFCVSVRRTVNIAMVAAVAKFTFDLRLSKAALTTNAKTFTAAKNATTFDGQTFTMLAEAVDDLILIFSFVPLYTSSSA